MCKHCYEKLISRTGRVMLVCELLENNESEIDSLCACQRYCSDKDKYIPYNQNKGCKKYEWENISVLLG